MAEQLGSHLPAEARIEVENTRVESHRVEPISAHRPHSVVALLSIHRSRQTCQEMRTSREMSNRRQQRSHGRGTQKSTRIHTAWAETKDIVMGYSPIAAKDFDEAVALTNDHPIFDEGGVIEIRPILK